MIPSRGGPAPSIHVFAPRAQLRRGVAHHHRTAHLQLAAAPVRSIKTGPGCGAGGRWRCLAGLRDDAPNHTSSGCRRCGGRQRELPQCRWAAAGPGRASRRRTQVPPVWRAPEGAAAVPVGGGAWPGFETTHPATRQYTKRRRCGGRRRVRRARAGFEIDHSEPQARVWRSRGRPGPTAPGTPSAPGTPAPPGTPAAPQATKTPEPEAVPGSGGGGWGIRTPEGLHPTRFPSVRHRPLGESSVHIVPDNHKRKMSARANPGQWSRSQARHFKEKGITWDPNPPRLKQSGQQTTPIRHAPTHQPQRRWHPRVGPRPRRLAEPEHVDVGGNANKNPIEHEGGGGLT